MTENDLDDIEVQDDLNAETPAAKPSFKEVWASNPLLKFGAAILVAAVGVGAYTTLTKPNPIEETKSLISVSAGREVGTVAGMATFDKTYTAAVQKKNEQRAEAAKVTGGSSLPTPVATAKGQGIDIPQVATATNTDPLQEWKNNVEARRLKTDATGPEEDIGAQPPQPELVPMVQPVRPQAVQKMDPQAAQALSQQMRTVIGSQVPGKAKTIAVTSVKSGYEKKLAEDAAAAAKTSGSTAVRIGKNVYNSDGTGSINATDKVIIPAGQISYAQLLMELNSDIPVPVLATVMSGPFAGGRAIGEMKTEDEYLVLTFDRIVKDDVSYSIKGLALDEATTLPAQQTSIDHHYLQRVILPMASQFVSGYGNSISQTGTTTTTTSGGGVASSTPKPDAKESLYKGISGAAKTLGDIIEEDSKKKPTIHLARGTTMGILFLDPVKTSSAEE